MNGHALLIFAFVIFLVVLLAYYDNMYRGDRCSGGSGSVETMDNITGSQSGTSGDEEDSRVSYPYPYLRNWYNAVTPFAFNNPTRVYRPLSLYPYVHNYLRYLYPNAYYYPTFGYY